MQTIHQYVERSSGRVHTETFLGDRWVHRIYHPLREQAPLLFRMFTRRWASRLLGGLNYDLPGRGAGFPFDPTECLRPLAELDTPRKRFERQIRYWDVRPMPEEERAVVSPSDARALVGSLRETSRFFLKEKFFQFEELLGRDRPRWLQAFHQGDFAVLRLTPEKYHFNHTPVAGKVLDHYAIDGDHHACNPSAVVAMATPYSLNQRVVTVLDTDIEGGTGVGLVAMVEVVALMIGQVVQCYSEHRYEDPGPIGPGKVVQKGCPKSLFRPGSSTVVLLFEPDRVKFAEDLLENQQRPEICSRFSLGFGQPLVETDVQVRSMLATAKGELP